MKTQGYKTVTSITSPLRKEKSEAVLSPERRAALSKKTQEQFKNLNYPAIGRSSAAMPSKKPVMSVDFKCEINDKISIPENESSATTGYQVSETVVTKTKITHSSKNTKTIFSQAVTKTKRMGMKSPDRVSGMKSPSPYTSPIVAIESRSIPKKQVVVKANK
jgi:hypothetical protein